MLAVFHPITENAALLGLSELLFPLALAAGHQAVLVHHQTGLAAVTVTTLGYQVSHLTAAKVPSPVSQHAESTADHVLK